MAFNYELVILSKGTHQFMEVSATADSVADAFQTAIRQHPGLLDSIVTIYGKKPKSGDLQLMGTYDGSTTVLVDGQQIRHVLKLANGKSYVLTDEGFRAFFY